MTTAIITSILAFGEGSLLASDGQHFRAVATAFGEGRLEHVSSYRLGRPLFPLLAYLLSGATQALVVPAMVGIFLASVFALGMVMSRAAGPAIPPWALLVCPGLWFTVPHLVAEPLVAALLLGAYAASNRRAATRGALASLSVLAKESALVALAPLIARTRNGRVVTLLASLVPLALWWGWIKSSTGTWPWEDAPGEGTPLALPMVGAIRAARHVQASLLPWLLLSVGTLIALLAWCLYRTMKHKHEVAWQGAAAYALMIACAGEETWRLPGEAMRLMLPAQVLALVAWHSGRTAVDPRRTRSP